MSAASERASEGRAPHPLAEDLAEWRPDPRAIRALFSPEEIERLDAARRRVSGLDRTLAYCVYENPFARGGGVFAVASNLPRALRQGEGAVLLLSPFHRRLASAPPYAELNLVGEASVPFAGESRTTQIFEYWDERGNRWILFQADGMFEAEGGATRRDPYVHADEKLVLRDALFAAAAIPFVLAALGASEKVVVHVQEWQLACAALTVKSALLDGTLDSAAVVLTSHNPYDRWLPSWELAAVTDRIAPQQWPLGDATVYQRMIPLTDAPLSTVSENFARELTEDPLQAGHFAGHLQASFRAHGLVGINNALFGEPRPPYRGALVNAARASDTRPILAAKAAFRRTMLESLEAYRDERIWGRLTAAGDAPLTGLADDVPVFFMFGRADPAQKGFDVLARAIELTPPGAARFILSPIIGDSTSSWGEDLRLLTEARPGEVTVYPFRMERGYMETMAGASYVIMPSLYEPFGAATEAFLAGTPVVARATGGLVDQVDDVDADPQRGAGLLWREAPPAGLALDEQWRLVETCAAPSERAGIPLYAALVEGLRSSLARAIEIYREQPTVYASMLASLFDKCVRLSPESAAEGYTALYDAAVRDEPRI